MFSGISSEIKREAQLVAKSLNEKLRNAGTATAHELGGAMHIVLSANGRDVAYTKDDAIKLANGEDAANVEPIRAREVAVSYFMLTRRILRMGGPAANPLDEPVLKPVHCEALDHALTHQREWLSKDDAP
jgi:hypothetical protein